MIQQVNLYQNCLKQDQSTSAINQYIYTLIAIVILLTGFSIYLFIEQQDIENTLKSHKQQLTEAETKVQLLHVKYPKQQINKLLSQEISNSQNMLSNLNRVISLLSDKSSDQTQGFSRYFIALARQNINDVWLTKISINSQSQQIHIQGSTYKPKKIPTMLEKLHNEIIFKGKTFAKLTMEQEKDSDNKVNFSVSTSTEADETADHNE